MLLEDSGGYLMPPHQYFSWDIIILKSSWSLLLEYTTVSGAYSISGSEVYYLEDTSGGFRRILGATSSIFRLEHNYLGVRTIALSVAALNTSE